MKLTKIQLPDKQADGYEIPVGPFNLVFAATGTGTVVCGAFDLAAFDKHGHPAAKVTGVKTVDDLLAAAVKDVNEAGRKKGIHVGMTGRQALEKL